MTGNEPLRTIPSVRLAIPATDYCACLGERKCVEASINGGIAANLYEAQINLSGGAIIHEMMKVVFFFRRSQAWFVRNRRQQNGAFGIVGNHLMRIARLQRLIPTVKQ